MEVRPVTQNNIRRIYTYYSTVLHHKYKADIDTIHTYQYSLDQKSFVSILCRNNINLVNR